MGLGPGGAAGAERKLGRKLGYVLVGRVAGMGLDAALRRIHRADVVQTGLEKNVDRIGARRRGACAGRPDCQFFQNFYPEIPPDPHRYALERRGVQRVGAHGEGIFGRQFRHGFGARRNFDRDRDNHCGHLSKPLVCRLCSRLCDPDVLFAHIFGTALSARHCFRRHCRNAHLNTDAVGVATDQQPLAGFAIKACSQFRVDREKHLQIENFCYLCQSAKFFNTDSSISGPDFLQAVAGI